ncbi:hypothetical protein NXF25_009883 [Crotalus adamanteus]|uniref:WAP domain-containing protein n=1 Tax=Crotalus adamanteus TaxID=8729 RepID=A0AAW1BT67_CROAD
MCPSLLHLLGLEDVDMQSWTCKVDMENTEQCKPQNKEGQEIDQSQIDQQQILVSLRQQSPLLYTPLSCTQHASKPSSDVASPDPPCRTTPVQLHHETLDSSTPSWSPHPCYSTDNSKDHKTTCPPKSLANMELQLIHLKPVCSSSFAEVKPGECPLVKVPADYPCDQECVWDSDCKGDKKCCPAGCARECFPPGPH